MGIGITLHRPVTGQIDNSSTESLPRKASGRLGSLSVPLQEVKARISSACSSFRKDVQFTPNSKNLLLLGTAIAARSIASYSPVNLFSACAELGSGLAFLALSGISSQANQEKTESNQDTVRPEGTSGTAPPDHPPIAGPKRVNATNSQSIDNSRKIVSGKVTTEDGHDYTLVWAEKNDRTSHVLGILSALNANGSLDHTLQYLNDCPGEPHKQEQAGQSSKDQDFDDEQLDAIGAQLNIERPAAWLKEFISTFKSDHPEITDSRDLLRTILELATEDDQCDQAFQLLTGYQRHQPDSAEMKPLIAEYPLTIEDNSCECTAVLEPVNTKPPEIVETTSHRGSHKESHGGVTGNSNRTFAGTCLTGLTIMSLFGTGWGWGWAWEWEATTEAWPKTLSIPNTYKTAYLYGPDGLSSQRMGAICDNGYLDPEFKSPFGTNQPSDLCDKFCISYRSRARIMHDKPWTKEVIGPSPSNECREAAKSMQNIFDITEAENKYHCKTLFADKYPRSRRGVDPQTADCIEQYATSHCQALREQHMTDDLFCDLCNVAKDPKLRCNQPGITPDPAKVPAQPRNTITPSPKTSTLPGNTTTAYTEAPATSAQAEPTILTDIVEYTDTSPRSGHITVQSTEVSTASTQPEPTTVPSDIVEYTDTFPPSDYITVQSTEVSTASAQPEPTMLTDIVEYTDMSSPSGNLQAPSTEAFTASAQPEPTMLTNIVEYTDMSSPSGNFKAPATEAFNASAQPEPTMLTDIVEYTDMSSPSGNLQVPSTKAFTASAQPEPTMLTDTVEYTDRFSPSGNLQAPSTEALTASTKIKPTTLTDINIAESIDTPVLPDNKITPPTTQLTATSAKHTMLRGNITTPSSKPPVTPAKQTILPGNITTSVTQAPATSAEFISFPGNTITAATTKAPAMSVSTELTSPPAIPTVGVAQYGNNTVYHQPLNAAPTALSASSPIGVATIGGLTAGVLVGGYCIYSIGTGRPITWGFTSLMDKLRGQRGEPVPTEDPEEIRNVADTAAPEGQVNIELEEVTQPLRITVGRGDDGKINIKFLKSEAETESEA